MNNFAKLLLVAGISSLLAGCPTTPTAPPATVSYPPAKPPVATPPPPPPPVVIAPPPAPPAVVEPSASETALAAAISTYERNNLRQAISLLTPLAADGGPLDAPQRVRALKYLAFSQCSSTGAGALVACRQAFERAFRLDPSFELAPAERGHPLWGPEFDRARKNVLGR
jgi:hypothetical protein